MKLYSITLKQINQIWASSLTTERTSTTYIKNHGALPPLVSNQVEEYCGADIRGGETVQEAHVLTAFQQHKMRRVYSELNRATPEEVLASKKRETVLIIDSKGLAPVDQEWAQGLLRELRENHQEMNKRFDENHQEMNKRFDENHQEMNKRFNENHQEMNKRFDEMNKRFNELLILTKQNTNRTHVAHETIVQVPNNKGEMPPDHLFFPLNEVMITSMQVRRVDALLHIYGIEPEEGATTNHKKSLLSSHLGLQRLADTLQ